MNKRVEQLLKLFLGLGIIGLLFYNIGTEIIVNTLLTTKPLVLIATIIFHIIALLISALSYYVLIKPIRSITYKELVKPYLKSWITSLVTPGKLGELSIAYFLKEKITIGQGTAVFIIEKLIMMLIIGVLAIIGFFKFLGTDGKMIAIQISAVLIIGFLAVIVIVIMKKPREIIKRFIPEKYKEMLTGFSKTFITYRHHKKALTQNFTIAIARQLIWTFALYYLILSFGQKPGIIDALLIFAAVSIAGTMPITPGGLGVKEATAVILFNLIGISSAAVLSALIILNVAGVILAIITYFTIIKS